MKVTITGWKGVATWSWKVPKDEVCGICRVSFDGTCSACKYPGDECPLVVGVCSHRFHMHCIVRWLDIETSKNLCPMCRQTFEAQSQEGEDEDEGDGVLNAREINVVSGSSGI